MIDLEELDPQVRSGIAALVAEMSASGVDREDPVRSVMASMGDRWSPLILLVLETGIWRHAELRRVTSAISAEGAISQRVLTLKLRALERDGFVLRDATDDVPPKVSYSLSPLGRKLVAELRGMIGWLVAHRHEITAARQRYSEED